MVQHRQHQIKRTLQCPAELLKVREQAVTAVSKAALAAELCELFDFHDPCGRPQLSTCAAALTELECQGEIAFPLIDSPASSLLPAEPPEPNAVPHPVNVPRSVEQLNGLTLKLVDNNDDRQLWSNLMKSEHPLGDGPLVGRQLKYLVDSECGILGALGFAASALHLAERDHWIGWDDETRRAHLDQIICLSRLLIRPQVCCGNLASRVLAMALKQVKVDFPRRYGYCPLLIESFSDPAHGTGSTYRAANWRYLGQSKGRGRHDRANESATSVKDIYVYVLHERFREELGLAPTAGRSALAIDQQLEADEWAEHEFGGAPLGDARLSKRLVQIAEAKAHRPGSTWSGVAEGDWARVKGYYRFIDQPDESGVCVDSMLASHRDRTLRRMDGQQTVLCIQDGTSLDFSSLDQCEGLGVIGSNQTGAKSRGLDMHSTFAVTTEGLPLGVLRSQIEAPVSVPDERAPAHRVPIEEKKTFCWIEGLRDLGGMAKLLPQTKLISVMDREADIYEVFEEQTRHRLEVVVRAQHNRCTTEGEEGQQCRKLFDQVARQDSAGQLEIDLGHQSARTKKSKVKARPARPARTAVVDVRFARCELKPPSSKKHSLPLSITIIQVREEAPPEGVAPLEWYLLTSLPVDSLETATEVVSYYCKRWRIEDWHRVLKSGCNIEEHTHRTAERLRRALAVDLVIGWRVMLMTLLGRSCGDLPAEVMFSDIELRVLQAWAKERRLPPIKDLASAVNIVGRMGGHLGRKNDPPPGHQLIWNGQRTLGMFCVGFALRE